MKKHKKKESEKNQCCSYAIKAFGRKLQFIWIYQECNSREEELRSYLYAVAILLFVHMTNGYLGY